jgi:hypothetical protein
MEPTTTAIMMELLSHASNTVLASEDHARAFDFRETAEMVGRENAAQPGGLDPQEIAMVHGVPVLLAEPEAEADQHVRFELIENRRSGHILWAKIRPPRRGPHFFSAFGLFMLMQSAANHASYEDMTVPAMAGIAALTYMYFEELGEEGWQERRVAVGLDARVQLVATADDPRAVYNALIEDE